MADRLWFEKFRSLLAGATNIAGSFAPNGASAVDSASVRGKGFTVVRTSAGVFTITFADQYAKLISATATLQLATADDKYVLVGTYTAASKTLVLNVWDVSGAALTDVAADANNRINFSALFSISSVD